MKDEQLFVDEFNRIMKETEKCYPAFEDEVKDIHSYFNAIIHSWDIDMMDHGIDYELAYYKKCADETNKELSKRKANIDEYGGIKMDKDGNVLIPENNPHYLARLSGAFFLSATLKTERFIVKYLEGLKGLKGNPDGGKAKKIIIIGDGNTEKILSDLTPYFEDQSSDLKALIEGGQINDKLKFNGNASQLADYFGRLHEDNIITGFITDTQKWIIDNFVFLKGDSYAPFTKHTTDDYLRQKSSIGNKKKIGTDWLIPKRRNKK